VKQDRNWNVSRVVEVKAEWNLNLNLMLNLKLS
jgi:hypothetical protein